MTFYSMILIVLALICYSIGVWSERFAGLLKSWHLIFFWIGLVSDTIGTALMFEVSEGFSWSIHSITGVAAILLMAIHAIWATIIIMRNDEKLIISFHKFSVFVWVLWLIPFLTGMIFGMASG